LYSALLFAEANSPPAILILPRDGERLRELAPAREDVGRTKPHCHKQITFSTEINMQDRKNLSLKACRVAAVFAALALPATAMAQSCPGVPQLAGSIFTQNGNTSVPFPGFSFDVPSAADTLLVVHLDLAYGATLPTSMTFGGTPMTLLNPGQHFPDSNSGSQQVWFLVAPTAGAATLQVATSGNNVPYNITAETFAGVNQQTPIQAVGAGTAEWVTSYSSSITLNHNSPSTLVDFVSYGSGDNPSVTLGSGQTLAFDFIANPSNTVNSTKRVGVDQTEHQYYTFQWPEVVSSISLQLMSACP
jgi:hypothetical protein